MIENAHKHLEPTAAGTAMGHHRDASIESAPRCSTRFWSSPSRSCRVHLQSQEAGCSSPRLHQDVFMGAAALLSITLAPVLMGFFIRGGFRRRKRTAQPAADLAVPSLIDFVIRFRWAVIGGAAFIVAWVFFRGTALSRTIWPRPPPRLGCKAGVAFPYQHLARSSCRALRGRPALLPTTFPGISPAKARELLQQTDRIIHSFPEVHQVFGKVGRARPRPIPRPWT